MAEKAKNGRPLWPDPDGSRRRMISAMKKKGIGQVRLAINAGLKSKSTVNDFLRGKTQSIEDENLEMICAYLGVTSHWIIYDD